MKEHYKIGEISRLYGIGTDSLRYYEKLGILKPRRNENGYREYGLKDIYKLNIIRDLRKLDFSMAQIKEYMDGQSVDNTIALLAQEREWILKETEALTLRERILGERIATLRRCCAEVCGEFRVRKLEERPCLIIHEAIERDEEMDFVIKKLHRRHEDKIRDFGNLPIGAYVSMEDFRRGRGNVFRSVFFLLEAGEKDFDDSLPAGEYISHCYRGSYRQSPEAVGALLRYAENSGWEVMGDPFEIYRIDNRDTIREEEFLTEIQVRVAPGRKKA